MEILLHLHYIFIPIMDSLSNKISLNQIENDAMKTVMCSNSDYIFLGNSNAISDQSLYMIEKVSLTNDIAVNLIPLFTYTDIK